MFRLIKKYCFACDKGDNCSEFFVTCRKEIPDLDEISCTCGCDNSWGPKSILNQLFEAPSGFVLASSSFALSFNSRQFFALRLNHPMRTSITGLCQLPYFPVFTATV
jgi:hypothetical protein